jgi:hypothetical protein
MIWLMVGIFLSPASVATKLRLDILVGIFLKKFFWWASMAVLKKCAWKEQVQAGLVQCTIFLRGILLC